MFRELEQKPFIIAGPCSAGSKEEVLAAVTKVKELEVPAFRASLWKPRTQPGGFEGVGEEGIEWLKEVGNTGLIPATEVLLPSHVEKIIESNTNNIRFILWLGSRNQNHFLQRDIARLINTSGSDNYMLMIKNQPWQDEKHWLGIFDHVLSSGLSEEKIFFCHRGFHPGEENNPHNFRNVPDFDMAMKIKEKTKRIMLFDPSHVGGSIENVFLSTKMALEFPFNGFMLEFNANPKEAKTDQNQQLDPVMFARWLRLVGANKLL